MKSNRLFCVLCWIAGLSLAATLGLASLATNARGQEKLPDGLNVIAIEAQPAAVELKHRFDYRQVLVLGKLDTGEVVDLTRMAQLAAPAKSVTVSTTGIVSAAADGAEQLTFRYGNLAANVVVNVAGSKAPRAVSFVRDVQPVLSKTGCNAGTCHGSKDGKNGFKLSLRGYDAIYDHRALTDDIGARRFNRAAPDQSLMLLKATGSIPHVGSVRMTFGDAYYDMIRQWIADGVKLDLDAPRVAKIEVFPKDPIVPRAGMKQQMVVVATYADGAVRDVTREAFIESGNIEVIEASPSGVLTMLRRGEAPVLVRYEGAYAASTIIVMGDRSGFQWQQPPTFNYIDELVYQKLQRVKILPSDVCTDDEFIRRVYLDLTGLPPSAEDARAFFADPRDSRLKREELVDRLVGSHSYVEHWTNKFADLLQVNRKFLGEEGSAGLRNWIKDAVATNRPYDQFAREVITASGSNLENPPASYYKTLRDPSSFVRFVDGVSDLKEIDPTHYEAVFETRVAYLKFKFNVTVEVTRADEPSAIEAKIEGNPLGVVGRLTAKSITTLEEAGGETKVTYSVESTLAGKLGSIGQPVLRSKAKDMEKLFAQRLRAAFAQSTPA